MNQLGQKLHDEKSNQFSKQNIYLAGGFSVIYLLWIFFFVGLRSDHFYFLSFCLIAFFSTRISKQFILGFIFFIFYWIIYDSMRVYPNYMVNPVHIEDLYNVEKSLFGISTTEGVITPNEYFDKNRNTTFDILSGLFYLTWVPVPLMLAIYFFFKDREMLLYFSLAFLLTNLIGFIFYYVYPAAPPWYVDLYGFELKHDTLGNSAGLANFDQYFGISLFKGMYEKNANVFAAIPSLHSAYPVVLVYFGLKKGYKIASVLFFITMVGIWWAAVYSMHHYIIDVILGAVCSISAILLFEKVVMKSRMKNWLYQYRLFIEK